MPELPEVETVKNTLKNYILGKTITDVIINYDGIIKNKSVADFKNLLINQKFQDIRRLGKYLFFDFDNITMTSHLRMEGKYFIRNSLNEITKHEHIIFVLDNSKLLTYHDVRKFGTMELTPLHMEKELKSIQVLGKEIISDDLTIDYLYPLIKKSSAPIKTILLDQHILTGLGNIYVDETLFLAKIHPKKPGNKLTKYQVSKIIDSGKKVINKAIKLGGTTIRTYQSSFGVDGRFQNELNVHTLVNQPCKICNDTIIKTKVGGRGTYLCPTCQRNSDTLIIGLTGGIASGKTFVSDWFKNNKINVLDADKIYKKLLKTNKIMYNEIAHTFGESVVSNNQIDRQALGKIIFNNKEKRLLLNSITHPYVLNEMNKQIDLLIEKGVKIIILDIPLLFEAKLDYLTDLTILVYVDKDTQTKRLITRDQITKDEALSKINSQLDLEIKKSNSDIIVNNNSSKEETIKILKEIYDNLRSDGYVN